MDTRKRNAVGAILMGAAIGMAPVQHAAAATGAANAPSFTFGGGSLSFTLSLAPDAPVSKAPGTSSVDLSGFSLNHRSGGETYQRVNSSDSSYRSAVIGTGNSVTLESGLLTATPVYTGKIISLSVGNSGVANIQHNLDPNPLVNSPAKYYSMFWGSVAESNAVHFATSNGSKALTGSDILSAAQQLGMTGKDFYVSVNAVGYTTFTSVTQQQYQGADSFEFAPLQYSVQNHAPNVVLVQPSNNAPVSEAPAPTIGASALGSAISLLMVSGMLSGRSGARRRRSTGAQSIRSA